MKRITPRILTGFAMLGLSCPATAQLTNATAEDFAVGTRLVFQTCQPEGLQSYPGGKDALWDYSGLKPLVQDTTVEEMIAPAKAPYSGTYPDANIVEQYSDGKLIFIRKTKSASYLLGYVDTVHSMKSVYERPVLIARRPFTFGQKVTDSFTTAYSVQAMDFKGSGNITIEADGQGTLILPNGTYKDVLRVKMVQAQNDLLVQYSSPVSTEITTYVWFDNRHRSALLKITEVRSTSFSNRSVEYLLRESR